MNCKYKVVMFDLDGTITDSAKGVRSCIEKAMNELKKDSPSLDDVSKYVGPPLLTTFKKLCKLSDEEALKAIDIYRKHYEVSGIKENKMYSGIDILIEKVKNSGAVICIATSKYEGLVDEVLEIIGLSGKFDIIVGSTLDGKRKEKADVIKHLITKLDTDYKIEDFVLIGDTTFDANGANTVGCDFIGVTYGCGKEEEMKSMGVSRLCKTTLEIEKYLFT